MALTPRKPRRGDSLSARYVSRLVDSSLQKTTITGTGVSHRIGTNLAISDDRQDLTNRPPFLFWLINSAAATSIKDTNGNPVQWIYNVSQTCLTSSGYGGWATVTDGFTGNGYNMLENGNDGTGTQGNGVDHDGADYPAGFKMQPINNGVIVPGVLIAPGVDGVSEVWFWPIGNGEDGTCT